MGMAVATVLFCDLVESTALSARLGDDAYDDVRVAVFTALRRAVADHRGTEVKSLGDGIMAVFPSATDALGGAAAMVVDIETLDLALRVGVSAGEVRVEHDDYFGAPVVEAARLCAKAAPGQVLVSDVVSQLVGTRGGHRLESVGAVELKGLPRPLPASELLLDRDAAGRVDLLGDVKADPARIALVYLAANRHRPVTDDELAEAVGPGAEDVRPALSATAVLDTDTALAQLEAAEEALDRDDVARAGQLAGRAAEILDAPLLPGVERPWLDALRAKLEMARLRALDATARAALAEGDAARALEAAGAAVVADPFRESSHRLLITAHAAAGNRAAALRAYEHCRSALASGLGVRPSTETEAVYLALLGEEAAPAVAPAGWAQVPPRLRRATTPFAGRAAEATTLQQALTAARAGGGRVVLLAGDAGIGKTRLCSEFAASAVAAGAVVAYGRSDEDLGLPYQPFVEAFTSLLEVMPQEMVDSYAKAFGGALGKLAPVLARRVPSAMPGEEPERHVVFDAVRGLLNHLGQPAVLIVDDLHWADRPTIQLFRFLADHAPELPLVLVGALRESELEPDSSLAELVARLRRLDHSDQVRLGGLDNEEIAEIVAAVAHTSADAVAQRLTDETGGNPLFATELLRHLVEIDALDGWVTDAARPTELPDTVRDIVGHRASRLGTDAKEVLSAAALIGHDFDLAVLLTTVDQPREAVLGALDAAEAAHLVGPSATAGRFAFNHTLIADALEQTLSATRRGSLHVRIADTLADGSPGELASHLVAAGPWPTRPACTPPPAPPATTRSATSRRTRPSGGTRRRWPACRSATTPPAPTCSRGSVPRSSNRACPRSARRCSPPRSWRSRLATTPGSWPPRSPTTAATEPRPTPSITSASRCSRPRCSGRGARTHPSWRGRWRSSHWRRPTIPTGRCASPAATPRSTWPGGWATRRRSPTCCGSDTRPSGSRTRWPQRHDEMAELVDLAEQLGDPMRLAYGNAWRGRAALESGNLALHDRCVAVAWELSSKFPSPFLRWNLASSFSYSALIAGDLEEAERKAYECLALADEAGEPDGRIVLGDHLLTIRDAQGRLDELAPAMRRSLKRYPHVRGLRATLAYILSETGALDEASTLLHEDAADGFARYTRDLTWMSFLAYTARAAANTNHVGAATVLYDLLAPWHDQVVWSGATAHGPVALLLGQLALVTGRADDARGHLRDAFRVAVEFEAPHWVARVRLAQAQAFATTEPEVASEMVNEALTLAGRYGFGSIERKAVAHA